MKHLQTAIVVIALGCMGWLLADQWSQISALELHPEPWLLSASVAVFSAGYFAAAGAWRLILRALGHELGARAALRAWIVSAMARYIPGGVWSYASRAVLARRHGIPVQLTGLSLYIEMFLLAASALGVGVPALITLSDDPTLLAGAVALLLACGLLLHPRVLRLLAHLLRGFGDLLRTVALPSGARMLRLYGVYLLYWCSVLVAFLLFVAGVYPPLLDDWLPVAASMPLAYIAGRLAVFVPGGIGVRESAMFLILLPLAPESACLLIAIGSRIVMTLAEGITLALALCLRDRALPPAGPAPG